MSKRVMVIKSSGETEMADLPENSYDYLSAELEGWIQAVPLARELEGLTIWVNEEGKLNGLPINMLATQIWEQAWGKTDVIVGTAIITGGADDEGETKGLTEMEVLTLLNVIGLKICEVERCGQIATRGITYRPGKNVMGRVTPDMSIPETRLKVCSTHDLVLSLDMFGTE